ncbi:MAG TPA: MarR family transcriptional regulator [Herpetosiphonaceae bacterium]
MVELIGSRLSTATVLFHSAIADRLGVSATDVKCYTILRQSGPISAGELAERVALTTGAITGVIDRLEKAQLVRRAPDPRDRRRVVLELLNNPEREQAIMALYQPMGQAMIELVGGYSAAERAVIQDFITRATEILETETLRLRQGTAGSKL